MNQSRSFRSNLCLLLCRVLGLMLVCLPTRGLSAQNKILNLPEIAGKSQEGVSGILGKPEECSRSKYGQKCTYTKAGTEIVFINGKADWITVNEMGNAQFSKNSLALLGLPIADPSFRRGDVMRWDRIAGLREVSFFSAGPKIFYAYVKTKTP